MRFARMAAVTMVGAVALAGCSMEDPDGEGAEVVADAPEESTEAEAEATEAAEPTEDEAAAQGSRENPLPIGTTAKIGDYEVAVTEVVLDATQQNLDDNEFNDAPPEGTQYVLVSLSGKYVGDDSGDPGMDLYWKILGSSNNTFDATWSPEDAPSDFYPSCTLDSMYDIGETFPDGEWSGRFCILVPSDQAEGSAIILEELSFGDSSRTFWATQ